MPMILEKNQKVKTFTVLTFVEFNALLIDARSTRLSTGTQHRDFPPGFSLYFRWVFRFSKEPQLSLNTKLSFVKTRLLPFSQNQVL